MDIYENSQIVIAPLGVVKEVELVWVALPLLTILVMQCIINKRVLQEFIQTTV